MLFILLYGGTTSWRAYWNTQIYLSYEDYNDPNSNFVGSDSYTFWHPQPLSVFINPNTEVTISYLEIYDRSESLLW